LAGTLKTALEQIIVSNPKRPAEHEDTTPEETQYKRDVETVRFLLTHLPIDLIEAFIERLPGLVLGDIFHFWEGFHAIWTSMLTHIYRPELREILSRLHDTWEATVSFGHNYSTFGDNYSFNWGDGFPSVDRKKLEDRWNEIQQTANALRVALHEFINIVNHDYIEINLIDTTRDAHERYRKFSEDYERRMNELSSE
jgi:hypothetical protein